MGKKFTAVLLALAMVFSMGSMGVLAVETVNEPVASSEPIGIVPLIDRIISVMCWGNGAWVTLEGDNNLWAETVQVQNRSNKDIEIKAYSAYGDFLGSATLVAEAGYTSFKIPFASGTYYFKARFVDDSVGFITIRCLTI